MIYMISICMNGKELHMKKTLGRLGALTLFGLSIFLIARWKKKKEDEALAEAIREEMENEDH